MIRVPYPGLGELRAVAKQGSGPRNARSRRENREGREGRKPERPEPDRGLAHRYILEVDDANTPDDERSTTAMYVFTGGRTPSEDSVLTFSGTATLRDDFTVTPADADGERKRRAVFRPTGHCPRLFVR